MGTRTGGYSPRSVSGGIRLIGVSFRRVRCVPWFATATWRGLLGVHMLRTVQAQPSRCRRKTPNRIHGSQRRTCFRSPHPIRANGREKGIVREAFRGLLPDVIIDRKKSPYPKTHNPMYFRLCAEAVKEILKDGSSPLKDILDPGGIENIIEHPESIETPWYGQLMRAPQILAYIIQLDYWFRSNRVEMVGV